MKLKYSFLINKIGDDFVAVPAGECIVDFNGIIKLNETAAFIVEKLNTEISIEDLTSAVADKFGCEMDYALENVEHILNGLKESGLLVE